MAGESAVMGQVCLVSGWIRAVPLSGFDGRRCDRFRRRAVLEPLFQQQHGGGTVEPSTAIAVQAKALAGGPAAAVFIHPGHRQRQACRGQGPGQPQPVAAAVERLAGGLLGVVQGQANHQDPHLPLVHQCQQLVQIPLKGAPQQSRQRCDRESEGIAASQADTPLAHIQGQGGTRSQQPSRDSNR